MIVFILPTIRLEMFVCPHPQAVEKLLRTRFQLWRYAPLHAQYHLPTNPAIIYARSHKTSRTGNFADARSCGSSPRDIRSYIQRPRSESKLKNPLVAQRLIQIWRLGLLRDSTHLRTNNPNLSRIHRRSAYLNSSSIRC